MDVHTRSDPVRLIMCNQVLIGICNRQISKGLKLCASSELWEAFCSTLEGRDLDSILFIELVKYADVVVDVDKRCVAISALWTLTNSLPRANEMCGLHYSL
jgi:hypothetical protein